MLKTVLFQAIQLSISMHFSSIWPIDRIQSGATTLGQSRPGSDGNEVVLCIPQSSSITGTSSSDYLVSYPGHLLEGSSPSVKVQSVYSTAPVDWAIHCGVLPPLQGSSLHILQPQQNGQFTYITLLLKHFYFKLFSLVKQFSLV